MEFYDAIWEKRLLSFMSYKYCQSSNISTAIYLEILIFSMRKLSKIRVSLLVTKYHTTILGFQGSP